MRERHAVTRELTARYRKATKKQQGVMLTDFCTLTGYSRSHAPFLLRNCGKRVVKMVHHKRIVFTIAQARKHGAPRTRARRYGSVKFLEALQRLWALSNGLCGKRLRAFLSETNPHLEACGTLPELVPAEEILPQLHSVTRPLIWCQY
jgi:hypothetical protein